jgi:hypothetical protein
MESWIIFHEICNLILVSINFLKCIYDYVYDYVYDYDYDYDYNYDYDYDYDYIN